MQIEYKAPELTLIGDAVEVVLGVNGVLGDLGMQSATDFEFEQD
jgi:hypothetical protein